MSFQYMPPVDGRSRAGFVGLRNGGATCYMNSVIQQLYMTPGVKEAILNSDDENIEEERSGSNRILYNLYFCQTTVV